MHFIQSQYFYFAGYVQQDASVVCLAKLVLPLFEEFNLPNYFCYLDQTAIRAAHEVKGEFLPYTGHGKNNMHFRVMEARFLWMEMPDMTRWVRFALAEDAFTFMITFIWWP